MLFHDMLWQEVERKHRPVPRRKVEIEVIVPGAINAQEPANPAARCPEARGCAMRKAMTMTMTISDKRSVAFFFIIMACRKPLFLVFRPEPEAALQEVVEGKGMARTTEFSVLLRKKKIIFFL